MSGPKETNFRARKMLGRYMKGSPRYLSNFHYQRRINKLAVYVDTDHVGCLRTRRSTSGGVILLGQHCIKGWSSTQKAVALSSGEAELDGVVEGGAGGLGCNSLLEDLGLTKGIEVIEIMTDSSAALGIGCTRGLGKVRHVALNQLWIQDKITKGEITLRKCKGIESPADMLTKHLDASGIERRVKMCSCEHLCDRHCIAPGI